MQAIRTKTVGEIVAGNFLMSEIFQNHGIDYYCEGQKTLIEVCRENAIKPKILEQELSKVARDRQRTHHFDQWQLDYLIDHIIHQHHYYVWVNLPVVKEYALKSFRMHKEQFPQLSRIQKLVFELADELERHLREEEDLYFPYIRKLVQAHKIGRELVDEDPIIGCSLEEIHADHIYMGSVLKRIASLCNDFKPPKDSPETVKVLYQKLKDFQEDFYQHVHLENNILFPKALKIEQDTMLVLR